MLQIVPSAGSRADFAVIGKLGTNTSSQLQHYVAQLTDEELGDMRIGLAGCTFLSSAGLRVIMSLQKRVECAEGRLVIHGTPPEIMDVFELVGFDRILTFE